MPVNDEHDAVTLDQFTKQADPFAAMPAHSDADIVRLIRDGAGLTPASVVLDVACGPGLVALALAESARHVTGLDFTPAMLNKAGELQRKRGLANLAWDLGRADALPYANMSFDAVVTRCSFHHFTDPEKCLAEMVRVCRPGRRVVVCDVYTTTPEQAREYDRPGEVPRPFARPRSSPGRTAGIDAGVGPRRGGRSVRTSTDGTGPAAGGVFSCPRRPRENPPGLRGGPGPGPTGAGDP